MKNPQNNMDNENRGKIYNLKVEKLIREASDNFIYFKDYKKVISQLEQILKIDSMYTKALLLRGDLAFCTDKYEQALKYYSLAIESDKFSAQAYGKKAGILNMLGRHKEALEASKQAFQSITLKDRNLLPSLYDQQVSLLFALKRFKEAKEVLKKASRILSDEDNIMLISSHQGLIDASFKEQLKKQERAEKFSLKLSN
jgi:tetratricopeptide (TPR) repeat protein